MFIKRIHSQWILIVLLITTFNLILFSSQYRWLAGILFLLIFIRIVKSQQSFLIQLSIVLLVISFPIFYQSYKVLNQPYQETTQRVKFIPHWTTYKANSTGYTVEGLWNNKKVTAFLTPKQCPPYVKNSIEGEATFQNGVRQRNSGGYDERVFQQAKGIQGRLTFKTTQLLPAKMPWYWQMEEKIKQQANRFPPYTKRYIQMLLFGMNSAKDSTTTLYQQLGIIHLFSLSGLHVYTFALLLNTFLLLLRLTRKQSFWLVCVSLFLFYFFAGQSVGIFRSGVMYGLRGLKSEYQISTTVLDRWSMALILHLLMCPLLLLTQGGVLTYAMSFCAMILGQKCAKRPFLFSISFFILTLPLMAQFFYQANPISIFLNELCIPIFSYFILPLLIIILLVSYIYFPTNIVYMMEFFLHLLTKGLSLFRDIPPLTLYPLSGLSLIGFFIIIYFFLKQSQFDYQGLLKVIIGLFGLFILSGYHLMGSFTMIDVGQGDSLFLQPSNSFNQSILIDCGGKTFSKSKTKNATYTLIPFLKAKRVRTLEAFFLTHADSDHMGDMLEVIKNVKVKTLYYSAGCEKKINFKQKLQEAHQMQPHMKIQSLVAPANFQLKDIQLQCIWPKQPGKGENNDSLVFILRLPHKKILLTGDLEKEGEQALLPELSQVDVLKVGHHGSNTATSEAFLKKTKPQMALISCGKHNRFGHPHQEVKHRLSEYQIQTLRTDEVGEIDYLFYHRYGYWKYHHMAEYIYDDS